MTWEIGWPGCRHDGHLLSQENCLFTKPAGHQLKIYWLHFLLVTVNMHFKHPTRPFSTRVANEVPLCVLVYCEYIWIVLWSNHNGFSCYMMKQCLWKWWPCCQPINAACFDDCTSSQSKQRSTTKIRKWPYRNFRHTLALADLTC